MTALTALHSAAGLVLGVLVTWTLGYVTNTLLLPLAAVLAVALLLARQGRTALAASATFGALSVTLFYAWLFAAVGDGLAQM